MLIVDDNQDAADSLALLLGLRGFEVRSVYNGEDGLEATRQFTPDCLLLDIAMPGMDGYAMARSIRRDPQLSRARLIALSAYSSEEHHRRARDAGFDHCLVKPADPIALEELLTMLQQAIQLAERTEVLAQKNVELAEETRELLTEMKGELKEVKEELREVKQEIREVKDASSRTERPEPPAQTGDRTDE